MKHRRLIPFFK